MDNSYFSGCFANHLDVPMDSDMNIKKTEHYTLEELDIMRNEIFADYGYKFKSPDWQNYFYGKRWYKPMYDDVNDQLTEIDKHNIKIILERKKLLQEKGEELIKTEYTQFFYAG